MASLQARHSRACAGGRPWTRIANLNGCTCEPMFYVVVRDGRKNTAEKVGKKGVARALADIGLGNATFIRTRARHTRACSRVEARTTYTSGRDSRIVIARPTQRK